VPLSSIAPVAAWSVDAPTSRTDPPGQALAPELVTSPPAAQRERNLNEGRCWPATSRSCSDPHRDGPQRR
jgi:hypothetical protein